MYKLMSNSEGEAGGEQAGLRCQTGVGLHLASNYPVVLCQLSEVTEVWFLQYQVSQLADWPWLGPAAVCATT